MTYQEWHKVFTHKVRLYDWYTCRRALQDCHDALALNPDEVYAVKLWAEIDALRERQLMLKAEPA